MLRDGPATVLEISPAKAYILSNGRLLWGQIPGLMIGGRWRANDIGPTGLMMVEAVRIELTGRYEGVGCPNVRRGVSSVQ